MAHIFVTAAIGLGLKIAFTGADPACILSPMRHRAGCLPASVARRADFEVHVPFESMHPAKLWCTFAQGTYVTNIFLHQCHLVWGQGLATHLPKTHTVPVTSIPGRAGTSELAATARHPSVSCVTRIRSPSIPPSRLRTMAASRTPASAK